MDITTKEMEFIAYNHFWRKGWYGVFEVSVPREIENKYHRQRVDLLAYDTTGKWYAYEIKRNTTDFFSGCKWSWIGHYNYFIMPEDLYPKVKVYVPKEIGVWVITENRQCKCIKRPIKQNLKCSHESMMFSFMQALSREYKKYRKILEKEDKNISKNVKKKLK